MKVLFLTNVPSPYRVLFFNELATLCDLTVLYQKKNSSERNSKWTAEKQENYKTILLHGASTDVDKAFCPSVIHYIDNSYDAVIICGTASLTEIIAIEWCKLNKIPYYIEGDGAFAKEGNGFKEKLKKHLISGGVLFFSTCAEHDNYYTHYGADSSNVKRYRFSSLMKEDILTEIVSKEEKKVLRDELDMKEEKIVLAVGQFIPRKGFDVLLEAATQLSSNIGIYIVGDNPSEEYLSFVQENTLKNVHFEGFKTKEELKKYYMAADIFVLPTREDIWGLVVNEAMAYGLPVVTTDRCNAGLELIQDDVNGYIVPVGSSLEIRNAITKVLSKDEKMGLASLERIKDYTIENMAKDHISILRKAREEYKNN